jgi:hypothetical protein
MKIALVSDLHLEFGPLNRPMPDGDILILGGDISLIGAFDPEDDMYFSNARLRERTLALVDQCRSSFRRIFYLIGNHEAYGSNLDRVPKIIRRAFKGVEILENKAVQLPDATMAAATPGASAQKTR